MSVEDKRRGLMLIKSTRMNSKKHIIHSAKLIVKKFQNLKTEITIALL